MPVADAIFRNVELDSAGGEASEPFAAKLCQQEARRGVAKWAMRNHLESGGTTMAAYHLLITEVTNFGKLRCVAGWDLDREKMIRPEPHPTGFWQADKIAPAGKFEVGKTASFIGTKPNPATGYPHMTEDRVVTSEIAVGPVVD